MKPRGLYILNEDSFAKIYGPEQQRTIGQMVSIEAAPLTAAAVAADLAVLDGVDCVFSGWGGPRMDASFLAAAPSLRAVFYGAGSIKNIVTPAFWEAGIPICSAWGANAVPVAEFTLAQIILCLKGTWQHVLDGRARQAWPRRLPVAGAYGSTVGLVSLGMIGRKVCELLRVLDVDVIAYDPFVDKKDADSLGVRLVELEAVFAGADVVSLHTPWLPETEKMIGRTCFEAMRQGAAFVNTARGAVVDEAALVAVLEQRPDLLAVLDVTYPEPPVEGSPLYALPNVVLTPHIAGSMDRECRRMGQYMVEECRRFLSGESLQWQVSEGMFARMA